MRCRVIAHKEEIKNMDKTNTATNPEVKVQNRRKTSLKCLSLGDVHYLMCKILAKAEGLSASAYLRNLIKKTYQRYKKKNEVVEAK
jgi:hypothetical protein